MMSNDQKIDETPQKWKKRPKNGPKHEKWPKMGQKAKKMAYFLNPSVKNFDFLTKSFIYIFLICFGTFFPVAKNLGQKWFGGGVYSWFNINNNRNDKCLDVV